MLLKIYIITCIFSICSLYVTISTIRMRIRKETPWYVLERKCSRLHSLCLDILIVGLPIINLLIAGVMLIAANKLADEIIKDIKKGELAYECSGSI